jgi:hypothetical protein
MLLGISSGILLIGSISSIAFYHVYRKNIADGKWPRVVDEESWLVN